MDVWTETFHRHTYIQHTLLDLNDLPLISFSATAGAVMRLINHTPMEWLLMNGLNVLIRFPLLADMNRAFDQDSGRDGWRWGRKERSIKWQSVLPNRQPGARTSLPPIKAPTRFYNPVRSVRIPQFLFRANSRSIQRDSIMSIHRIPDGMLWWNELLKNRGEIDRIQIRIPAIHFQK